MLTDWKKCRRDLSKWRKRNDIYKEGKTKGVLGQNQEFWFLYVLIWSR